MKLDLCCGPRKPPGYYGIDLFPFSGVDLVHDLSDGTIPLPDNSCEIVRAHDAIEHIKNGMKIMQEIWRVLKDGGKIDVLVPSTDGRGAFQDLTHVSYWNQNSFGYWVNPAAWMDYYRGRHLYGIDEICTTQMSADHVCHVIFKGYAIKTEQWLNAFYGRNKVC